METFIFQKFEISCHYPEKSQDLVSFIAYIDTNWISLNHKLEIARFLVLCNLDLLGNATNVKKLKERIVIFIFPLNVGYSTLFAIKYKNKSEKLAS